MNRPAGEQDLLDRARANPGTPIEVVGVTERAYARNLAREGLVTESYCLMKNKVTILWTKQN